MSMYMTGILHGDFDIRPVKALFIIADVKNRCIILKQVMDSIPMFTTKIITEDRPNSQMVAGLRLNSDRFFNLACALYMNKPPDGDLLSRIEQALSDTCELFFLSDNKFLYTETSSSISPENIWNTAGIDTSGIFRRKIKISDGNHELESDLYTIYLGKNLSGHEIGVGILEKSINALTPDHEHFLYGFLGNLKRCYVEFSNSSVLNNFIRNKSAFQYVINTATNEVITTIFPPDGNLVTNPEARMPQLLDNLQQKLPKNEFKRIKQAGSDRQQGNISIANCTIMSNDYSIISINPPRRKEKMVIEHNHVMENVTIKIRDNLRAIQDAAGRLNLQKGRSIDDNDIARIRTIHSSTDNLNRLIDQLDRNGYISASGDLSNDIDQMIESILSGREMDSPSGATPVINYEKNIQDMGKLVSVEE